MRIQELGFEFFELDKRDEAESRVKNLFELNQENSGHTNRWKSRDTQGFP